MSKPRLRLVEKSEPAQDELAMSSPPNPFVTMAVAVAEFNFGFWMMGMNPESHRVQKTWWS
ncbi:MAG: hypothetical protein JWM46_84 [Candidatus Kaiserbacteria bacterium]|nr:hypothetical protein [Candidatus Kaiserbacteria bacterium]